MIDQEKVSLMTKLAIYEKREKKNGLVLSRFFETDYVRYNILKTWVASTVAYWLIVACYTFLHFDEILGKVNDIDYFDLMYKLLGGYVLFVFVYFVFGTFVYHIRYEKVKGGLVEYNGNLRKLIELDENPGGKVKASAQVENIALSAAPTGNRKAAGNQTRGRVSRMDMVNARLAEEQEAKKQEIIANVNRLNEKREREQAEEAKRRREIEMERERVRARRRALEEQQMARVRNAQDPSVREDHTYLGNNNRPGGNE